MASVTTISRPVQYPPYLAPWCPKAVLDAVPFFSIPKTDERADEWLPWNL